MLKIYKKGEHKGGFIGVRVAVMVGGKHRQKYFGYKNSDKSEERIYEEAAQLHQEWLMLKNLTNTENQKESKELRRVTTPYSTGIKGIKFRINHKRASFFVQGSTDKKLFNKNFSINDYGYDLAWYKACEFLQTKKDYSLFDTIYKRKPQKEMLLITFRYVLFNTDRAVHLDSISSIIEKPIFISWLKQILRQHSDANNDNNKRSKRHIKEKNKVLKSQLLEYLTEKKIRDKALLEMI